jgi:hypothetical protein
MWLWRFCTKKVIVVGEGIVIAPLCAFNEEIWPISDVGSTLYLAPSNSGFYSMGGKRCNCVLSSIHLHMNEWGYSESLTKSCLTDRKAMVKQEVPQGLQLWTLEKCWTSSRWNSKKTWQMWNNQEKVLPSCRKELGELNGFRVTWEVGAVPSHTSLHPI